MQNKKERETVKYIVREELNIYGEFIGYEVYDAETYEEVKNLNYNHTKNPKTSGIYDVLTGEFLSLMPEEIDISALHREKVLENTENNKQINVENVGNVEKKSNTKNKPRVDFGDKTTVEFRQNSAAEKVRIEPKVKTPINDTNDPNERK